MKLTSKILCCLGLNWLILFSGLYGQSYELTWTRYYTGKCWTAHYYPEGFKFERYYHTYEACAEKAASLLRTNMGKDTFCNISNMITIKCHSRKSAETTLPADANVAATGSSATLATPTSPKQLTAKQTQMIEQQIGQLQDLKTQTTNYYASKNEENAGKFSGERPSSIDAFEENSANYSQGLLDDLQAIKEEISELKREEVNSVSNPEYSTKSFLLEDGTSVVEMYDVSGEMIGRVKVDEYSETIEKRDGSRTFRIDSDQNGQLDYSAHFGADGKVTFKDMKENTLQESAWERAPQSMPLGASFGLIPSGDDPPLSMKTVEKVSDIVSGVSQTRNPDATFASKKFNRLVKVGQNASNIESSIHYLSNPDNTTNQVNMGLAGLDVLSFSAQIPNATFERIGSQIPYLFHDVSSVAFDQMGELIDTGTYDESQIWQPVANFLGHSVGLGGVGDKAIDYQTEGSASWANLSDKYGFWEGTKRKVWYHLIEDAKNTTK